METERVIYCQCYLCGDEHDENDMVTYTIAYATWDDPGESEMACQSCADEYDL